MLLSALAYNHTGVTTGVFQRRYLMFNGCIIAKTSKQEVCAKCKKQSPYKKKDWSGLWIMCDTCSKWYHKECTNVKTVPKDDEKWECRGCEQKP